MQDFRWCESDRGCDRCLPRDMIYIDAHTLGLKHFLHGLTFHFEFPVSISTVAQRLWTDRYSKQIHKNCVVQHTHNVQ